MAWLTPAEVAQMHRISRTTVYRLIYANHLTSRRAGIQHRIREDDARALDLTARTTPATA